MDKRYQVFVSSTYTDLKEERRVVIETLMKVDCMPAGMELFPASDEEQLNFIKRVIDDCDYYRLVDGLRCAEGVAKKGHVNPFAGGLFAVRPAFFWLSGGGRGGVLSLRRTGCAGGGFRKFRQEPCVQFFTNDQPPATNLERTDGC